MSVWPAQAALEKLAHPRLTMLSIVSTHVAGDQLPAGLLSPHFPPSLDTIMFCDTLISTFPEELFSLWRHPLPILSLGRMLLIPTQPAMMSKFDVYA
ncbi:TPA: hypothetical protein N0F65_010258 [Lagenidium giganteum]|uniref:Uncharacterized protein n=1 Tax=Lagenidium giganteum TaxID=4803 RepID=A0AAV2YCA9_9STRA|nr:TPA: hypothetical protein N0F65_010258 [Lagenidium giganteum]